jgi:hypothetical protein
MKERVSKDIVFLGRLDPDKEHVSMIKFNKNPV